ncbi:MAG: efflux RND transporter periplasmic adaptor subunit [Gammaproteobacteria bacterium]|nr:efflux RND transporter periplasmic adaptor subunit [Gammaproteobacteria bacterium]
MKLLLKTIIGLTCLTGTLALAQGGFPAPVEVAKAELTQLAPQIKVPGTVLSRDDARLSAEVAGNFVTIVDVGTRVAEGDVLAKIEDALLLEQQSENIGLVTSQKARIAFLQREVERLRRLAAQNNAARSLLDQTESDLSVARSELRVARARLAQIEIGLYKSSIRAPFAGRVTERFINPGERASIGDDVVRVVNMDRLEVVARAPLNAVAFLEEGAPIPVVSERHAGDGSIRAIVPFGDSRSHMFELRIDVPAADWIIGESVRVKVPTAAAQEVLAVPRDALVLRADGAAVYRVNAENKAERVSVQPGMGDGELISIAGDIQVGDTVVIRGAERLRPGQDVMINEAGDQGSGPAAAAGS